QAARQRFTGQRFTGQRFTSQPDTWNTELNEQPRLLACREAARREARAEGASEVGTHHQLIGLFEEGAAAAIMEAIGLRVDAVRQVARELFPAGGSPGATGAAAVVVESVDSQPTESAEAQQALTGAADLARRAGLSYVGTEHLLGALALDPG